MKTIAELQQEIRGIRKELNSLDGRLDALDTELLNYKDVAFDHSEYKRIYEIAKAMPIIKHPLIKENIAIKNNYFGILLMIATIDDSISQEQLLFLQRMILSDPMNDRLDYYLKSLGTIRCENVLFQINETVKLKLGEQLLLDMIILANLTHGNSTGSYEMIASIAAFLGKNKECLANISKVALAVLQQDVSGLQLGYQDIIDMECNFGYYLSEINGWSEKFTEASIRIQQELRERQVKGLMKRSNEKAGNISEEEEYGEDWYYYKD